ncbi:MAG TPA: hypothetical protein VIK70_11590 [Lysobacter sp.]
MQTTGMSRGDGAAATVVALVVNGLIVWQLQALLAPPPTAAVDDATTALQVVWIEAIPRRDAAVAASTQPRTAIHASAVVDRPRRVHARPPDLAATAAPAGAPVPARPMTAVYLQQAGQWAQEHPVAAPQVDPFADRRVALRDQAASRFRLKRPVSVADAVAMVGVAFGNPPHPCVRNPDDVAGYATGGDALALQMALDVERHCRP